MTCDAIVQIAALDAMSGNELRTLWKDLFQQETKVNHKPYLISRLAYRIQEIAYGGLSEEAKETLNELKKGNDATLKKHRRLNLPPIGTKFVREHNGINHEVMVTRTGFEYQGRTYKSLSEIAREITGTRWSGPLFFGLRESGPHSTEK